VLAQSSRVPFLQSTIVPFEGTENGRTTNHEQTRAYPIGSNATDQRQKIDAERSSRDAEEERAANQAAVQGVQSPGSQRVG